jgi:hypothetical protein
MVVRPSRASRRHLRPRARYAPAALVAVLAVAALHAVAAAAHAAAPAAPACVPAVLDASAQLDEAVTVSPMPGSADSSPETQISFLGVGAGALGDVTVTGSSSGAHAGRLEAYSTGDGASFVPARPFAAGELVTVRAQLTRGGAVAPLRYSFRVAEVDPLSQTHERQHALAPGSTQSFVSRPDLHPPEVSVGAHSPAQAPGEVMLAPYGVLAQTGPMILDGEGRLVWFDPLSPPLSAANLQVQQLAGAPVLTWWQGLITIHGFGLGVDVIDDTHYRTIAEVRAGNGDAADLHDFQITPQGTALITAYQAVHCDLAAVGGSTDSAVTDSLLQEIDIRTGLVMFEWTSLDHVALSASYSSAAGTTAAWPFDFFHLNSINVDPDGTLLVSSRNTWAAYDVDPATGQVLWALGGRHSTYLEGHGAATAYQHDVRPDGPGAYTVFDNGGSPQVHAQSRGVVLAVNAQTGTVSVREQFVHPGLPLLADSQGSLQALPGGDWFVGWGQEPYLSEFSPSGALLFDAHLPRGYESYRALSFPWSATPTSLPALAVRRGPGGRASAYASWNGATGVMRWELLEGDSPSSLARIGSVARTGFETAIPLELDRFAAVRALGSGGAVLGTSAAVALPR